MDIITNLRKSAPKAMIPIDIIDNGNSPDPVSLYGYYVENTEYYNIMPMTNTTIDKKRNKISLLGFIFQENLFWKLNLIEKIRFLEVKIDETVSARERLLSKKQQNKNFFTYEDKRTLTEYIKKEYVDVYRSMLKIKLDKNSEEEQYSLPEIIGYREEGKLHLVQMSTNTEIKIEPYSLKLDVFSRNTGILESDVMLNKKALFIGCGSVGSLVAVELAKSGVGEFMLVDMDVFGYHNICRHQCGIYDVGRFKTDAVADRILQINPYAKVHKYNCAIQDVDVDILKAFCTKDSIIIGGADNRDGDYYACKFAMNGGGAFISIGCWERAFAGEIFYCLPEMPDYSDFLIAIGYESSGRVTQNRRFYTTEEELEKVSFEPGISVDINFVTIVAVKIALDLLNRDNENFTQRVIPYLTQYTLVCNTNNPAIGGEQAEIFSYPLQVTTSIVVPFANKKN